MRVGPVLRCADGFAVPVVMALGLCSAALAAAGAGCAREPGAARAEQGTNASRVRADIMRAESQAAELEAEARRLLAQLGTMAGSNRLQRHILYHNLGCVYRQAGRAVEAEKAYVEAARLYPDAPDTQLGLGLLYESDLRQPEKALVCFERFLALAPENPAAGEVRSRIERLRGTANATEAGR